MIATASSRHLRRPRTWARDWQLVLKWDGTHLARLRLQRREGGRALSRGHEDTQPLITEAETEQTWANLPKGPSSLYCKHYTMEWLWCCLSWSLKIPSWPNLDHYSDLHQTTSSIRIRLDKRTSQLRNPISIALVFLYGNVTWFSWIERCK